MPIVKKERYIVTLEATVPVTFEYQVWAESQEDAFKQIDKQFLIHRPLREPKLDVRRLIKNKISVRDAITGISEFVKRFV